MLGGHPDVSQCAVIAKIFDGGERGLTGFMVSRKDAELSVGSLREWLGETLPDYMIPSRFVMLPSLPVTPNGKVDRKALDQLAGVDLTTGTEYLPPRNDMERVLVEIWQNVLKHDRIGVRDNFFDLGGHSLLVAVICSQISDELDVEVSLRSVFEHPTVESLAEYLGNASPSNGYMPMLREAPTERVNVESSGSIESIESLLIKQRPLVAPWKGRKLFGKSFLITLNHAGLKHGLFWCLQGYRELTQLASHLGPDQPVHGMRSGHLIMDYTDANIDLLASHYALEMMALQPEGPFIIGGNCQGGLIARAIALCIKRAGRSVSLLILMEESRFQDYDGPVALLFGSESILNPYKSHSDPEAIFNKSYPGGFTVDLIDGAHGQFFEEPNIESLVKPLKSRLKNVSPSRTPDLLRSSLRYFFIKIGRHSVSWIRSTWQK